MVGVNRLLTAVILLALMQAVSADCNCTSCDDCEEKLNNQSCTVVYLTADVIDHDWTCIDNLRISATRYSTARGTRLTV